MKTIVVPFVVSVILIIVSSSYAQFSIKNTPLDTGTWHKTVQNTPFDPKTWDDFVEDVTNPQAIACKQIYNTIHNIECRRSKNCGLTHAEKFYLRPFFGDLVDNVQVFTGTRIEYRIAGQRVDRDAVGITAGNRITTQLRRNELDPGWMIFLAHEMTHVDQYAQLGKDDFCTSYSNKFLNGFDYHGISFEHSAFSFEFRFAHYLQRLHSGYDYEYGYYVHESGSPYIRRSSVRLPRRLYEPPQEYGNTSLFNTLDTPIEFYWYDEGREPKLVTLAPNERFRLQHKYPGGKVTSPKLFVRMNNRQTVYRLGRFRSTKPNANGKAYKFAVNDGILVLEQYDTEDTRNIYKFNGGTYISIGEKKWIGKYSDGKLEPLSEVGRDSNYVYLADRSNDSLRLSPSGIDRRESRMGDWKRLRVVEGNSNSGWVDLLVKEERQPPSKDISIAPPTAGIPTVDLAEPNKNSQNGGGHPDGNDTLGVEGGGCCCCCCCCCCRSHVGNQAQCLIDSRLTPLRYLDCAPRFRIFRRR